MTEDKTKSKKKPASLIRKKTLNYLATREHSSFELEQKLLKNSFKSAEIKIEIEALKKLNYLSDQRFCQMLIHSRKQMGYGPSRLIYELKNHQIAEELIISSVDENNDNWLFLAIEVKTKKFGNLPPKNWQEKAKQMRFLQSRGFNLEQINQVYQK